MLFSLGFELMSPRYQLHVLYVYSGKARPNAAGLDLVVRQQLQALVDAGHWVTFLSRGRYEHPRVTNVNFSVTPANFLSSLPARYYYNAQHRFFAWVGAWLLARRRFDAVVSWTRQSRKLFIRANAMHIPCFLNCTITHYKQFQGEVPLADLVWPHINACDLDEEYYRADFLLTASDFARDSFLAHGLTPERVLTLGRGADTDRFQGGGRPERPFRVVFFGLVCDRKGIFQAIEAWRQAAITNGEFWIIGSLPKEIRAEVEARLPTDARLFGHRSDPEQLLAQCHVQILPTRSEGMAKSLVEGAACGLVTLTTRESGFPVVQGETGFYVQRDDVAAMAGHLRSLARNPEYLQGMAKASAEYVRRHLTWACFRKRFQDVLTEGCSAQRASRSVNKLDQI
jgi:glycosyltransferase involved in cell wall biosynthesis